MQRPILTRAGWQSIPCPHALINNIGRIFPCQLWFDHPEGHGWSGHGQLLRWHPSSEIPGYKQILYSETEKTVVY